LKDENNIANKLTRRIKMKIADLIFEARCAEPGTGMVVSQAQHCFLIKNGQPDCILNVHYKSLPDIKLEKQVFDTGDGHRKLFRSGEKLVLQLLARRLDEPFYVYLMAMFEPDFSRGELFIRPVSEMPSGFPKTEEEYKTSLEPFCNPVSAFLLTNLLTLKGGLNVHSVGIVQDGQGLVFCGLSGSGKSTTARLWQERQSTILSDERVSLRKVNGKIWAYGTPWQSSAQICSNEKVPLKAFYFIEHGEENRIIPLNPVEIVSRLMTRCFIPSYLYQGMELTLDFINELAQEVPCFEFQFTPDQNAIDKVLEHVKNIKP
jgi:hypothetical protein